MKINRSLFLLAVVNLGLSCWAATLPDSCGNDAVRFQVKTQKNHPLSAGPDAGKAQIVFIENFEQNEGFCIDCKVTTRVGVDGNWVGANLGSSYFAYSVQPGEHHLCVDWQSDLAGLRQKVGLLSLTAEPDQIYYVEIKVRVMKNSATVEKRLALEPLDSDEGKYLSKITPLATATLKN